jgi:aryl-alcohol dehydrogenase-like predicted oxidoreductase
MVALALELGITFFDTANVYSLGRRAARPLSYRLIAD